MHFTKKKIEQSTLLKLQFINQFELKLTPQASHLFKINYYSHIKKDIKRICALPLPVRKFIYEKGYSLKEICHLIHYSTDYVKQCIEAQDKLAFSKRSFDQIISNGCELMKRYNWSLDELNQNTNFYSIIQSDQPPQQNQAALSNQINAHLHPILTQQRNAINGYIQKIHVQTGLNIQYDASLEHKQVQLSATISSKNDLENTCQKINNTEIQNHICNILEKL